WSGPQRVRDLLPEEAADLLRRRFAIIQVWRPIRYPVETFPLAICDARSLSPENLVVSERRYPHRVGQTYAITYNPEHRWYWFPRMRRDEALVFKVYDSLTDGRARWTAHTAFPDPTSPHDARPRESFEFRPFAFFYSFFPRRRLLGGVFVVTFFCPPYPLGDHGGRPRKVASHGALILSLADVSNELQCL